MNEIGEDELASCEAELLASLRRDEPSAAARHAVAAGLGIGSVAAGGAAAGAGATSAAGGAALPSSAKIGPLLLAKWLGVGMTAGVVSLGTLKYAAPTWMAESPAHVANTAAAAGPRSPTSSPIAPTPAVPAPPLDEPNGPRAPSPAADSPGSPMMAERSPGPRAWSAPGPYAGAPALPNVRSVEGLTTTAEPATGRVLPSTLAGEIALLDGAQNAVTAKDSARALEILHQYAREFPSGTLRPEAEVLRIEALFLQGSLSEAVMASHDFLRAHPTSTHAARLRRLLADYQKP